MVNPISEMTDAELREVAKGPEPGTEFGLDNPHLSPAEVIEELDAWEEAKEARQELARRDRARAAAREMPQSVKTSARKGPGL